MDMLRPHVVCVILSVLAGSASADVGPDLVPLFARCTGRLSAMVEHQWLIEDGDADQTDRARDAMADLLAASTPPGKEVMAMALRIEAKAAMANLLSQARFARDHMRADWARRRVGGMLADCTALMIS